MRAVLPPDSSSSRPILGDLPAPVPGVGELLLDVRAAGLNHADLLQLRGHYPPPPGEPEVPGLECSGVVEAVGPAVSGFGPGDRVMALLAGGAHGTKAAAPFGQVMPLPESWSFEQGAALPEAAITSWTNLVREGGLQAGESVLVTGATGGMGTMMVQLAHEIGARVLAAGRDPERLEPLRDLGAESLCTLDENLPDHVRDALDGEGVDLVIDLVGGEHTPRCLKALGRRGRLVLVGVLAGTRAEVDLADVLRRRLTIRGSVLRARSREEKAQLVSAFWDFAADRLADGRIAAQVDRTLPFDRIADAYEALGRGGVSGKVVVTMD